MKNVFIKFFNSDIALHLRSLINNYKFLNFNAFIFLSIVLYRFYNDINFDVGLLCLILSFLISLIISNFVLNKFKYSENIYLRSIQKFLIFNIFIVIIVSFFMYLFYLFDLFPTVFCSDANDNSTSTSKDNNITSIKNKDVIVVNSVTDTNTDNDYYNFKISKNAVDKTIENLSNVSKKAFDKIVPNMGAGAAAGTAAAATIKATYSLPPLQRAAAISATSILTAASTKIGLDIGSIISRNSNIQNIIKNSEHANPDIDRGPSPDLDYIKNILESGDITSPLQDLLLYSFVIDVFLIIIFIILSIIIFNRYILSFNLNYISSILFNYTPKNLSNWFKNKINTGINFNSKLILLIFILNIFILILLIFLKLIISSELLTNIDTYIEVHNCIHKK